MTAMRPSKPPHLAFRISDKIAGWFGASEPGQWLTLGSFSCRVSFYEVDGRRYLIDPFPRRGQARDIERAGHRGTLSYDGTDTEVTFTEVTDPAVKHQVVIAYAAEKPRVLIAAGEHKDRPPTSFLVDLGLARDDTPEGLLPAVPQVAVFEVVAAF